MKALLKIEKSNGILEMYKRHIIPHFLDRHYYFVKCHLIELLNLLHPHFHLESMMRFIIKYDKENMNVIFSYR